MLPFKLVCAPTFYLPIGQSVFAVSKYRLLCEQLLNKGIAGPEDFLEPPPASDEDVLLVHTPEYVEKLRAGTLSVAEQWQLEVPYSRELVQAYWLCAGGTILAAQHALEDGVAFNMSGGFHHAFPDHGEGFNLINDVAVAIRRMQKDAKIQTAMTVDCDVHHGNGTAAIFGVPNAAVSPQPAPPYLRESPVRDVFTISLHQENNYPAWKPPSSIDVGLPDGTGDEEYLAWLEKALSLGLQRFQPDLICYLAGSDPYGRDLLGGLGMSVEGLRRRDELVFGTARARGIPVLALPAGGYASEVRDTVTIHANTILAAREISSAA
ncbi:MAG TPA: histone deacetylase [Candidatus Acidoferrales bacterium]|nr:histone deacetylase [Candidatus Acidoferrales bacterium]